MYQSIDRYEADPGGQATFSSGHKITVYLNFTFFTLIIYFTMKLLI